MARAEGKQIVGIVDHESSSNASCAIPSPYGSQARPKLQTTRKEISGCSSGVLDGGGGFGRPGIEQPRHSAAAHHRHPDVRRRWLRPTRRRAAATPEDKRISTDSAVEDLDAPLDIVRYEGKLYSLRNRRATVPPRNHKDMFMMQSFKVGPPMSSKHTPPKLIPMALGKLCTRTRSPQTVVRAAETKLAPVENSAHIVSAGFKIGIVCDLRLRVLAITAVTPRSSVARHREALSCFLARHREALSLSLSLSLYLCQVQEAYPQIQHLW